MDVIQRVFPSKRNHRRGPIPGTGKIYFLFATASRTSLGPTYPIQWVPGAPSLEVKRPEHEADHSPPSITEVKNVWSYTSTSPYVFMAWYLVKHKDKFTFKSDRLADSRHSAERNSLRVHSPSYVLHFYTQPVSGQNEEATGFCTPLHAKLRSTGCTTHSK
jgi:hypothetical protein